MGARERFAAALNASGALGAWLRLRKLSAVPTVSILTYHHVADEDPTYAFDPGVADATPAQFRRQLELCARYGTPITIDELIRALDGAPLPKNPLMVTFDDGYRSCHDVALPILKSVGIPATFFVTTSFVTNRRVYWWDRIAYLLFASKLPTVRIAYPSALELSPRDPAALHQLADIVKDTTALDLERFLDELAIALRVDWSPEHERLHANNLVLTWDAVRALAAAGMDIESHSRSHRVLQTLDPVALRDELQGSRRDLETALGRPVRAIAYPVGRRIAHLAPIREAVAAAGYRVGFTNATGSTRIWPTSLGRMIQTDRFDVRRLATDRAMSDAIYLAQIAVPRLGYIARHRP
jgi:peptidoglycan/xylan/chitin deacetylase (PgdA/CDA1 family)